MTAKDRRETDFENWKDEINPNSISLNSWKIMNTKDNEEMSRVMDLQQCLQNTKKLTNCASLLL
jgi:hypothetical protein